MQCPHCKQPIEEASKFCNHCGHPLTPPKPPGTLAPESATPAQHEDAFIGRRFGNYHITGLLGEGGFAKVYLGEHIHLGTPAAIKMLHTQLADAADIARFREEARTIARLDHPRIVRVLDFGVEGHLPYLAMAYAPHGSLRLRHPRGTRLPLGLVLLYVKHITEGLQYAHDQKLIHRDIKPENMLLSQRNDVLLTDFGIALIAQSSRYENTRGVAGTAAYMAPEQLQGHPRPASDLYSLGIVLYEWLSGERPFQGSFTEIASQHVLTPPPRLREKVPDLPPMVEEVVLTALAKDPKERWQSARALANAFEQAIQDTGKSRVASGSNDPPAWQHDAKQLLPGPALRPTVDPLATSQVAVPPPASAPSGVGTTSQPEQPSADWHYLPTRLSTSSVAPAEPPPSTRTPSLPPTPPLPENFSVSKLAPAPYPARPAASNQPKAAPPAPSAQPPEPPGARASPMGMPLCIYPGHSAEVQTLVWLKQGKQIVSSSADNSTQVWESASGDVLFTFAGRQMVVSPNQERAAALGSDQSIHIVELTTGRVETVYTGHHAEVTALAWSPNSQHLASGTQENGIRIWEASSGETLDSYRIHARAVSAIAWSPDGQRVASADIDGKVRVRERASKTASLTYAGHGAKVTHVFWLADGKRLVTASLDGTIHVWETNTGKKLTSVADHPKTEAPIALSPNGDAIASVSSAKAGTTIKVWLSTTGSTRATCVGRTGKVQALAWSPDGQRIASAGKDGKVSVWNATTGIHQYTYGDHKGELHAVAWSPDGKRLASAGQDTNVHVWSAEPGSGSSRSDTTLSSEQIAWLSVASGVLLLSILLAGGTGVVAIFVLGFLMSIVAAAYALARPHTKAGPGKRGGI